MAARQQQNGSPLLELPDVPESTQRDLEQINGDKKVRLQRFLRQETIDYLTTIRSKVQGIDGFWPFTMMSHSLFKQLCTAHHDRTAFSYLSDVELKQDPKDHRPFEVVFHFRENPYFSNTTLSKHYTLPQGVSLAPADGSITQQMREFDADDLLASATEIDWKSSENDLVAKYPRSRAQRQGNGEADDEDEVDGDIGSFFCYFTQEGDPYRLGVLLSEDLLPDAIEYFSGKGDVAGQTDDDSEDELNDESGDENEEIDLEEEDGPARKRRKA